MGVIDCVICGLVIECDCDLDCDSVRFRQGGCWWDVSTYEGVTFDFCRVANDQGLERVATVDVDCKLIKGRKTEPVLWSYVERSVAYIREALAE